MGLGRPSLKNLPLGRPLFAILHPTHCPDLGLRPWLQSLTNLAVTATNIKPLSPQPPTLFSPGPSPLQRPSPCDEKGNCCLSEQNAVYAEQVEINLCQLFQGMARGLWMTMHQPSRGEREMIYYPPKEAGGSLAPLEPQLQDIF